MYAKFLTMNEALTYLPILQAQVDANHVPGTPRILKGIVPTYDGQHAMPLPDTYPDPAPYGGEVVESIDPPVVEMEGL